MKRIDFLRKLSSVASFMLLPIKKMATKKKTSLLQFHIRGFQYYEGPDLVDRMRKGDPLTLIREPKNRYDQDAIALYYQNRKIGFVPAEKNDVISRMLDNCIGTIKAEILDIHANGDPWEAVFADIYMDGKAPAAA